MRELRRLAWAAAFAAFGTAPAFGQQVTGQTISTAGTTQTVLAGSGTNLGSTGGTGGPSTQGPNNEIQLTPLQETPVLRGVSAYTSTTTGTRTGTAGGVQASNFLRNVYANPYYQGLYSSPVSQAPGGFGTALYPQTGTTGAGGRGGQGGRGATGTGTVNVQDVGGIIANLPRQIAYPSQIKFQAPALAPAQLQTDLSGMIRRTTMIANPAGVQVAVADGNGVVLRGTVRDADEARAVEGMVRMTPGVRQVKNELTYPGP
jgi:hypothetical protein